MEAITGAVRDRLAKGQMTAARVLGFIEGYAEVAWNVAAVRLHYPQPGHYATMRVELLPVDACPSPFSWNPTDPWHAVVSEVEIVEGNRAVPDEPAEEPEPESSHPADFDPGHTLEEVDRGDA